DEVLTTFRVIGQVTVIISAVEQFQRRHLGAVIGHTKLDGWGGMACNPRNADIAGAGDVDPDAVAGAEHLQAVAVPAATTTADESVLPRLEPGAVGAVAEGAVELAVPGLAGCTGLGDCRGLWRFGGVEQPSAAD